MTDNNMAYATFSPIVHSKSNHLYTFKKQERFAPIVSYSANKYYCNHDSYHKFDEKGTSIGYGPRSQIVFHDGMKDSPSPQNYDVGTTMSTIKKTFGISRE